MNLNINFLGKTFDNPIIPASGTFGFGYEFNEFYDINILGSISLKGTTLLPRYGNPLPRIADCPSGLINAIGLQNPGVDNVISKNESPYVDGVNIPLDRNGVHTEKVECYFTIKLIVEEPEA